MKIDGKIANRTLTRTNDDGFLVCGKCSVEIEKPCEVVIGSFKSYYCCLSYLGTERFVYEANSGYAVCYCSKYCAQKHNHRFRSK